MINPKTKKIRKNHEKRLQAIDLFCGAGGLTKGLSQAGIEVKLGVDVDLDCEYPFKTNNRSAFLRKSIEDLELSEIEQSYGKKAIRLLAGCAPCQTFSTYNQKAKKGDKRWWLLRRFSQIVLQVQPELVTMENVPGLQYQNVFQEFLTDLRRSHYQVNYQVVNCADYGIPQHRHRLVLLASRLGPVSLITPKELRARSRSVRDAISSLPPIRAGEICSGDPMHQSSGLSAINLRRIRSSKPGGTWRDWRKNLVAKCHKKSMGKTFGSVYGRMTWDGAASTITTQFFGFGNGRFGHPEQDRAISLREGAILQGFPLNYVFAPKNKPLMRKKIGKLIGNAVPVKLGKVIGKSLIRHVNELGPNARRLQRNRLAPVK